jgi:hypothetical protein
MIIALSLSQLENQMPEFYQLLHGWDTELYLTEGVRYCQIFVKLTESLTDQLLVQYTTGVRRKVLGMYLFTDLDLAKAYVEKMRQMEMSEIYVKIRELENDLDKILETYLSVNYEEAPLLQPKEATL